MPYEDLKNDEAIAFHWAVINKHQACLADLYAKTTALTDGEKDERGKRIAESMKANVSADEFASPIEIKEEPTPSESETLAVLEGEK